MIALTDAAAQPVTAKIINQGRGSVEASQQILLLQRQRLRPSC